MGESLYSYGRCVRSGIDYTYNLRCARVKLGLDDAFVPPRVAERFEILELLGRGAMGAVFRAHDPTLGRDVAIKVVNARLPDQARRQAQLLDEARRLAAIKHDNVLAVHDVAQTPEGERFIAMDYVGRLTLRQWQAEQELESKLRAYADAARGLMAAHEAGVIHCDFKPDNVLIGLDRDPPRVIVADLGLATRLDDEEHHQTLSDLPLPGRRRQAGTRGYIAPEQRLRGVENERTDQYAYCVSLWEALTGTLPFAGDRSLGDELPVQPVGMPRSIYRLLCRGLALDPLARYPNMSALVRVLDASRRRRHRTKRWLGAAVLGGSTLALLAGLREDPCAGIERTMAATWNADTREAIAEQMRAQHGGGPELAAHVLGRLERAAARWEGRARTVCEAREQGEAVPAHGQACLERWRHGFDRLVTQLRVGEEASSEHVVELLDTLARTESFCHGVVSAGVWQPLDASREALLLGELDPALTRAKEAVGAASRSSATSCDARGRYSTELGAALYQLGSAHAHRLEAEPALEQLDEARLHAIACDDDELLVDVRTMAARILVTLLGQPEQAQYALDEAVALLDADPRGQVGVRAGERWKAAAMIAKRRGDYPLARELNERGLGSLSPRDASTVLLRAELLANLSTAYQEEGLLAEAEVTRERARASIERALGPRHPRARALSADLAANAFVAREGQELTQELAASKDPRVRIKAEIRMIQDLDGRAAARRAEDLLPALDRALTPNLEAEAKGAAGYALAQVEDPRGIDLLRRALELWEALGEGRNRDVTELYLIEALTRSGELDGLEARLDRLEREPEFGEDLRAYASECRAQLRAARSDQASRGPSPNP